MRAVLSFDDRQDRLMDLALQLREMPARLLGRRPTPSGRPRRAKRFGLDDFAVLRKTDSEVAYGLVGRFWRADYGLEPCADLEAFARADAPGLCRLLLTFRVVRAASGGCSLETVTRVACGDRAARLRFLPYWLLIRPVSGLIRRRILNQVKRAAEALVGA